MEEAPPVVQPVFADALQHHVAGRLKKAEWLYRQILAVNPQDADSLHLLGLVGHQTGRHEFCIDMIHQAIGINAQEALYHSNLGAVLKHQGRPDQAAAAYRRVIELKPDDPVALNNLGLTLQEQGRLEEAATCYRRALDLKADDPMMHCTLGNVLKEQGLLAEAVTSYRKAIDLQPDFPLALNNLGAALKGQGRLDEAVASFRRAIGFKPDYSVAFSNLGAALQQQGWPDEAIACYRTSLAFKPDDAAARNNLGLALQEQGRLDDAVACYRKAVSVRPDYPEARFSLALGLLAQGDMAAGWDEYEWRWKTRQMLKARRDFTQPQWRGEAAEGRTLLIHAEQGFGDTLQFCRYAPLAAARGLRVILEVPKPLTRLLRHLPGVDRVVAAGEELPPFDFHCPMLSMPLAFGTTLETIPSAVSYLQADPVQVADWRTRLAAMANQNPRIGLVWAGNPCSHLPAATAIDRRRSLAPDRLSPLLDLSGLHFFSLQKDGPAAPATFPLTNVMDQMEDFADTAALITNLNLVITVDTAVAHLAAALGKPVWLLDRFDSCWRWLVGRRDSPWYPTLRLYRQPHPGAWDAVLAEVTRDLLNCRDIPYVRPA
jgi:tetratricopeptide (TPR) repeat protein